MLQYMVIKSGYFHSIQEHQVSRHEKDSIKMPKKGFSQEENGFPSLA